MEMMAAMNRDNVGNTRNAIYVGMRLRTHIVREHVVKRALFQIKPVGEAERSKDTCRSDLTGLPDVRNDGFDSGC